MTTIAPAKMKSSNLKVYCDASYSHKDRLGVAGFLMYFNEDHHAACNFDAAFIRTKSFEAQNNICAEIMGILWTLDQILKYHLDSTNLTSILIFTDCQTVVNLPERRNKLEENDFKSRRTQESLKNAELYRQFFKQIDKLPIRFQWLKGHTPKQNRSIYEQNISFIDRRVRKKLREKLALS
ncbi:MAG: hypothetical protein KDD48_00300 [Bdellovibrionales bacterium]|nr:hypothetical protein [Bdellovibrionales bacterium]